MAEVETTMKKQKLPPYISYESWKQFLKQLSIYLPSRFDSSCFDAQRITQSQRCMLKGTLSFLGLMSEDNTPTNQLFRLVKSEETSLQEILEEITLKSYDELFASVDLTRVTYSQAREYFNSLGASVDIGRKCLKFFIGLACDANIPLSPHLRESAPRGRHKVTPTDELMTGKIKRSAQHRSSQAWEDKLLDKFPTFDPAWPPELKMKWFEGFKLLRTTLQESSTEKRKKSASRRL